MTAASIKVVASFVLCGSPFWAAPATADYTAVILDTRGAAAIGVSDGQQVGHVYGHAALWSGTAASYVDLNPAGIDTSEAWGVSAGQQVGWGHGIDTGNRDHALLWSGTAESYVDLNPTGFIESQAWGASGGQQGGYGGGEITGWYYHALLWSGTAENYVDLNPSGFIDSWAYGISGGQQVGWGMPYGGGVGHALLWSGTPASCVDLHPPSGFTNSVAYGVSDGQQVGVGWGSATGDRMHALLWSGTAGSCVDLNPTGFVESLALGVSGGQQVGYGYTLESWRYHALLWSGTPESCVDLHSYLPAGYQHSFAYGIDSGGNIVGNAYIGSSWHAVLWVYEPDVVPTPPTIESISAPLDPVQVNTAVTASGFFSDPDAGDAHTALWDWGDGTATQGIVDEGMQSVNGGHTYTAPGTYALTLTVTDASGASDQRVFEYVVVYDPTGGFVTGAGWIESPAGAYMPDPTLAGRASFGFVSKYQKGANVPTGNTEFRFKAGDLVFHSSSYDWLVVTGSHYARFKGTGTINGSGAFKFMLWAGDGAPDTFRIKIWYEDDGEVVVYDNGTAQAIGGGSIIVHTQ